MKAKQAVWVLVLAFGSSALVQAAPQYENRRDADNQQEHRRDDDRSRNQDRYRNQNAYNNNKYYQQGWKDGLKHKHKNKKKWKNEADREAYEAGYMHGDRGEPWQNQNRRRDRDHDNDRH